MLMLACYTPRYVRHFCHTPLEDAAALLMPRRRYDAILSFIATIASRRRRYAAAAMIRRCRRYRYVYFHVTLRLPMFTLMMPHVALFFRASHAATAATRAVKSGAYDVMSYAQRDMREMLARDDIKA